MTETKPKGVTADDESGLLLAHLATRELRNAVELEAIGHAYDKHVFKSRKKKVGTKWLTDDYLRQVHKDMFGKIWDWAGKYRQVDVNIGMPWAQVPEQVRIMCDDFEFWDSAQSGMSTIEIAARLQNRLTKIHLFKNGNGRHARLITDIFFRSRNSPLPVWPQIQLLPQGDEVRANYISSMKKGDLGDFSELISFIGDLLPLKKGDEK